MDSNIVCPKCGTKLTIHNMNVLGHIDVDPKAPWNKTFWTGGYEYQCPGCGEQIPCGKYGNILKDEQVQ